MKPEISPIVKHMAKKPDTPDKTGNIDLEKLRKEAIQVLIAKYRKIKAEAEKERSIPKVKEASAMLDQIKELKENEHPMIDDLERIIGKAGITEITAMTPEGKEVKFELKEQLDYWRKFYKDNKIDWVELPENITITADQEKEIKRLIEELGFDKLTIIPENLAATGEDYERLQTLMGEVYNETYQGDNFKEDGSFKTIKNKSNQLRIIITKEVGNLEDDKLHQETIGKSIEDLEASDGLFQKHQVEGLDPATYLILQREYFQRTKGKSHLDEKGYTWLPDVIPPISGRLPYAYWDSGVGRLFFGSNSRGHGAGLGCRLSGSLTVI